MTITIWPFSLFNTQSPQNHAAIPPTGNNGQVQQQGQAAAAAQNHHQNQPEPLVDLPHIAGHGGAGDDLGERGHNQPQHRANPAATERPARRRGAFSSETYTEEDVANYVKTVGKWEIEQSFFCLGVQEAWLSSVFLLCFGFSRKLYRRILRSRKPFPRRFRKMFYSRIWMTRRKGRTDLRLCNTPHVFAPLCIVSIDWLI